MANEHEGEGKQKKVNKVESKVGTKEIGSNGKKHFSDLPPRRESTQRI